MSTAEQNISIIENYASQINDITNQNADDIATVADELQSLKDQVASSNSDVAAAFDPLISKLQANSDALKALANPSSPDNPAPLPSDGGTA